MFYKITTYLALLLEQELVTRPLIGSREILLVLFCKMDTVYNY